MQLVAHTNSRRRVCDRW